MFKTEFDGPYVLHIGVKSARDVEALQRTTMTVLDDRDSWEEWGEPLSSKPKGTKRHVMIERCSVPDLLDDFAWICGTSLVRPQPMREPWQRGCVAVITSKADFSEIVMTLDIPA